MQVYIKQFKSKKNITPLTDGIYEVLPDKDNNDKDCLIYKGKDGTDYLFYMGNNSNEYFSCHVDEAIEITPEGLTALIKENSEQMQKEINADKDFTVDAVMEIMETDILMVTPFRDLCSHILETYDDKYCSEAFPALDLQGLISGGTKQGSGFNIGNAAKYLKRYMTEGKDKSYDPKDLLKAIHYLLFEYDARINNNA
jgi:hypothetical protein